MDSRNPLMAAEIEEAKKLSTWLHSMAEKAGKGGVLNADGRGLGRAGDSIDSLLSLLTPPPDAEVREAWCPDVCPITGLEFFMWIEQRDGGRMVPTYGGPYDSYTIPVKDSDGDYVRERYDHDEGAWTDGYENCVVRVVDADELDELRAAFAADLAGEVG